MTKPFLKWVTVFSLFFSLSIAQAGASLDTSLANGARFVQKEIEDFTDQSPNLNPQVLRLALHAYYRAQQLGIGRKPLLTIIDYTLTSRKPRLWVIDLNRGSVLLNTLVAHGKNSGVYSPSSFSDNQGTFKTSLGVFVTGDTYEGHNGISLVLHGLEKGINDQAEARKIVLHGAWYVSKDIAQRYGRVGLSLGCPAVSEAIARPLIETIKEGSIVFAYYPVSQWLNRSRFLI